ncbi:MAG: glycosyltransferase [Rhodobacterales bacterium]|nr:glycosyltransferase [Rhodobacterales bacterium]
MGFTDRNALGRNNTIPLHAPESFGLFLVQSKFITSHDLIQALQIQSLGCASLDQVLVSEGLIGRASIRTALSAFHGLPQIELTRTPPDPVLFDHLEPKFMLKNNILPWKVESGVTLIATNAPDRFETLLPLLPASLLPAQPVIATRHEIQTFIATRARHDLTCAAGARVDDRESCRNWGQLTLRRATLISLVLFVIMAVFVFAPRASFAALVLWAGFTLIIAAALRTAAFIAHFRRSPPPETAEKVGDQRLPKVSVLVPLFGETEIAGALIARLSRLTYPKALLDVVLVLEENDALTRDTLAAIELPRWMRTVEVPEGSPKTKPRAMNYALDFCDGDIIGIWDAEDAPEPDQIDKIAARFLRAPPEVACLQGILDYYNSRQNWLARCFTIEYATWFRLMLPGMSRLGFAIPLGGTTLFFRRNALEELGGWDAHNVTEDADLGFRLARHGYRTEMIETVTGEEANCHVLPWIRQRSRWLKGYMVTYLVHMRAPTTLYRQLGARKFWGFQAHFITALSQFFLAPFLWSFWLILFGLPHPLNGVLPASALQGFGALFLTVELISIMVGLTAVSGPKHRHLLLWVPSLHFYYPLGVFAAYKALFELIFSPFYWDKTKHGHSLFSKALDNVQRCSPPHPVASSAPAETTVTILNSRRQPRNPA